MKDLIKKSKWNSLAGMDARRSLRIKVFGIGLLTLTLLLFMSALFVGGMTSVNAASLLVAAPLILSLPVATKAKLSAEELEGLQGVVDTLNTQFDEALSGKMDNTALNDKVTAALKQYLDDFGIDKTKWEDVKKQLDKLGIELKELKEADTGQRQKRKTLKQSLKEFTTKPSFKSNLEGKVTQELNIDIKAAVPFMSFPPDGVDDDFPLVRTTVDRTIHEAPKEALFVYNLLRKGSTRSRVIIWINRKDREGGSAFIVEGQLKPLMSWGWETETATPRKIAVRAKMSTEALFDLDFLEAEVRRLIVEDLWEKVDDKLLTGTAAEEPVGILNGAGGYVGTGLDGTIPMVNEIDVIRAAILQMRLLNYKPNVLLVNPTTGAKLDLLKDDNGRLMRQDYEAILRQVRIIENTAIGETDFVLLDTSKFMVYDLETLRLEFGWGLTTDTVSGDVVSDFEANMVTIIAEMRLFSYHNSIDNAAIIHDDFDVVKAILTI